MMSEAPVKKIGASLFYEMCYNVELVLDKSEKKVYCMNIKYFVALKRNGLKRQI